MERKATEREGGAVRAQVLHQLENIVDSETFRNSAVLQGMLRFLVTCHVDGRAAELKESVIAQEAMGRGTAFDGRTDNSVRVHAHRLREKLAAYYETEGRNDAVVIEVPKGGYAPRIRPRAAAAAVAPSVETDRRQLPWLAVGGLALAIALAFAAGWLLRGTQSPATPGLSPVMRQFWAPLVGSGIPSLVVYRNPIFLRVRMDSPLLLRYDGNSAGAAYERIPVPPDIDVHARHALQSDWVTYDDTWTETGVVNGVRGLALVYDALGRPLQFRRSQFVTSEDIAKNNLVILGAPWGNRLLSELQAPRHWVFNRETERIETVQPAADEITAYASKRAPVTNRLLTTFALVSLLPLNDRRVLVISGLNSVALSGGAEFVTEPRGLEELRARLQNRFPQSFQAVLQVEVLRDGIASTHFAAGKALEPGNADYGPIAK